MTTDDGDRIQEVRFINRSASGAFRDVRLLCNKASIPFIGQLYDAFCSDDAYRMLVDGEPYDGGDACLPPNKDNDR